jgi:uncharacterized integral membrane protein
MKEASVIFGSIVGILLGLILIYANVFEGNVSEILYAIGAGLGVIFLAAGVTGLWAVRRFKK